MSRPQNNSRLNNKCPLYSPLTALDWPCHSSKTNLHPYNICSASKPCIPHLYSVHPKPLSLGAPPLHHLAVHPHQNPPSPADICTHRQTEHWVGLVQLGIEPRLSVCLLTPWASASGQPSPWRGRRSCSVGSATAPQKFHSASIGSRADGSPTAGACQLVCPTHSTTMSTTTIQQTRGDIINMKVLIGGATH